MSSHKRTAHLLPAWIAGLGATLAIAAAMVGTAAAAIVVDAGTNGFRGAQDFRSSQSDAGLSALTAPAQDFGTQDFRGAQDFRSAASAAYLSAAAPFGTEITSALQPGQTFASIAAGNYGGSIGDEVPWAPASGLTSALQPGQTDSLVTPGSALGSGPTSALQPGQTDSLVTSGSGSGSIEGATSLTSALGPTSAPQPGQTGW
jgi:hypothetical protein